VKATVEAIFEDGVFKPAERPEIPEGEHVHLTVETVVPPGAREPARSGRVRLPGTPARGN